MAYIRVDKTTPQTGRMRTSLGSKVVDLAATPGGGLRRLIAEMARNNPTWGEERIAVEPVLKLGIRVSQYAERDPGQGWPFLATLAHRCPTPHRGDGARASVASWIIGPRRGLLLNWRSGGPDRQLSKIPYPKYSAGLGGKDPCQRLGSHLPDGRLWISALHSIG